MADWIERAAGPGGITLSLVYLELVLALTLLTTVLHFRRLERSRDELRAVRLYFLAVFVLFLALPCALTVLSSPRPAATLAGFGWTFGRIGLGLKVLLGGIPLAVLAAISGSRDPGMAKTYPIAKAACSGRGRFAGYELSYVVLYYLPWESVFRGVLFFPLVPAIGLIPALAVQTAAATLLHIGHPDKEIVAAALSGPFFGLIAFYTGSFVYPLILHATAGVLADTLLCRRLRRGER